MGFFMQALSIGFHGSDFPHHFSFDNPAHFFLKRLKRKRNELVVTGFWQLVSQALKSFMGLSIEFDIQHTACFGGVSSLGVSPVCMEMCEFHLHALYVGSLKRCFEKSSCNAVSGSRRP